MKKLRTLTEWSAAVKARDGRCMCCAATTALVAHHIKPKSQYPELKFDVDNGQTLCVDCHKDHHKENPVKGLGVGVVGRVQLKKRIVELEREVQWLTGLKARATQIVGRDIEYLDLKEKISMLEAQNAELRSEVATLKTRLLAKIKRSNPV